MFSSLVLAWYMVLSDDGSLQYESLHSWKILACYKRLSTSVYFLVSTWQFWVGFTFSHARYFSTGSRTVGFGVFYFVTSFLMSTELLVKLPAFLCPNIQGVFPLFFWNMNCRSSCSLCSADLQLYEVPGVFVLSFLYSLWKVERYSA